MNIKGINGREMYETWYKMDQLLKSGLDISKLLTHELPSDEYEKAFEIMESGYTQLQLGFRGELLKSSLKAFPELHPPPFKQALPQTKILLESAQDVFGIPEIVLYPKLFTVALTVQEL